MKSRPVIAFDIGGTWWRSGVVRNGVLENAVSRQAAITYLSAPSLKAEGLQRHLIEYLVTEQARLRAKHPDAAPQVAVCFGGAVDGNTGVVVQASQLWGPGSGAFDLRAALEELSGLPTVSWFLLNDVTAHLLGHLDRDGASVGAGRVALLTVSTGIALRTYDLASEACPVHPVSGLQGEIGHLHVPFSFRGRLLRESACDCGGLNHLNALASGRGLDRLLVLLARDHAEELEGSALSPTEILSATAAPGYGARLLARALDRGDAAANDILDVITSPVADALLHLLTVDPLVARVLVTGGLAAALHPHYDRSLLEHCRRRGLYQTSSQAGFSFDEVIRFRVEDDTAGLRGAVTASAMSTMPDAGSVAGGRGWRIRGAKKLDYSIHFVDRIDATSILDVRSSRQAPGDKSSRRRLLCVDNAVLHLYGHRLRKWLRAQGVEYRLVPIAGGEQAKTIEVALYLIEQFAAFGLARVCEPVIAVGGGALLDVVGFAASIYKRGTPYVRIPTTLLAMVDASVGVKTGVNFAGMKNGVGSYEAPVTTLIDLAFAATQETRQIASGLAEIIKIAIMADAELFATLERDAGDLLRQRMQHVDSADLVVRRATTAMLQALQSNLCETSLTRYVDFGHTFSPTLEVRSKYKLLHGEAVALDIAVCTSLALGRGLINENDAACIFRVLVQAGLSVTHPLLDSDLLADGLRQATIHRGGQQRIPLPRGIGRFTFVNDVSHAELAAALRRADRLASRSYSSLHERSTSADRHKIA